MTARILAVCQGESLQKRILFRVRRHLAGIRDSPETLASSTLGKVDEASTGIASFFRERAS